MLESWDVEFGDGGSRGHIEVERVAFGLVADRVGFGSRQRELGAVLYRGFEFASKELDGKEESKVDEADTGVAEITEGDEGVPEDHFNDFSEETSAEIDAGELAGVLLGLKRVLLAPL